MAPAAREPARRPRAPRRALGPRARPLPTRPAAAAAVSLTVPQAAPERGVAAPLPVEVNTVAQEGDGAAGRQSRQEAEDGADAGHPAADV